MFNHLRHLIASKLRERRKAKERSPLWPNVRDGHLKTNPTCAACGGAEHLQVHHVVPFAVDPHLELSPANLITLCMGPNEDHLFIGHSGDFEHYNPNVVGDAAFLLAYPGARKEVLQRAAQERRAMHAPAGS
jgi:5-methylcytosine-specific restriction protein A